MGYQDGMGLRPGRTKDKVSADRGSNDSTFSSAAGYRAAGSITPQRAAPSSDDLKAGGNERSALAQFNADDVRQNIPKAPGLLQTAGGAIAGAAGGKYLEKGVDKLAGSYAGRYVEHALNGSSIPFDAMEAANASDDAIGYLDTRGYFDAPNYAPVSDATGSASSLADPGYVDTLGDWGSGADAAGAVGDGAGMGFGDVAPYAGSIIRLAQGDIEGAAGAAAGTFVGNMILPGIGGFIGGAIGGGCFITEATMAGLGVQDDEAEPLKVLRFFRDQVLSKTPQGQAMIQEYEDIAPLVVEAVESRPDAMEIFKKLYTDFIAPAVEAIKAQNFPQALQIYAAMIAAVTPLAQEAMDAEDAMEGEMQQASEPQEGPQEAMQQMGQHAGMVAQSPQVAQQAAPQGMMQQGALQQFNADEEYPSSVRFGRR